MAIKSLISIREFAEFADIKQTTLRYYDELGIFSPITRTESGFRYYSPTQIIALNVIRVMQELNMPMKEIALFQKNRTPDLLLRQCVSFIKQLDDQLRKINHLRDTLTSFQSLMFEGKYVNSEAMADISIEDFETVRGILGPTIEYKEGEGFTEAFLDFCLNAKSHGMEILFPICGYFATAADFFKAPSKPTNFFLMDPNGRDEIPAGRYMFGHLKGDYAEMGDFPEKILEYSKTSADPGNKIDMNIGPVCHVFLQDETSTRAPEDYLSRLLICLSHREE